MVTYKGVPIRLSADFSKETLQARRGWQEVFQVMKGKDLHPSLLYPAKLSFRMEGKIKCFSDKVKLKEFITTKPILYEMLKGLIWRNQDGGIGRHTAPPRTTRTDRESNSKGDRHQGNRK